MKTRWIASPVDRVRTDLLVIGLYTTRRRSPLYKALQSIFGPALRGILEGERFRFKPGDTAVIHGLGQLRARQVLLAALGRPGRVKPDDLRAMAGGAARRARRGGLTRVALAVDPAFADGGKGLDDASARALMEGACLGGYRFDRYLDEDSRDPESLIEVGLVAPGRRGRDRLLAAMERGRVAAEGTMLARDLVNEPPNVASPEHMRTRAEQLADELGLAIQVLERDELERRGMGCLLAVGQGSAQPTYLIHLTYTPEAEARSRVALVGKCLTYDSGGLCIKSAAGMLEMKSDMGGAAAVLGTLAGAARLKLPLEIHAIFAATENMTGAAAYRAGDVLTASNGKTVEVINTDAEGRLTLADALVYSSALEPDVTLELATLTGACVAALGKEYTGMFTPSDRLARQLTRAGDSSGDRMWRLPLADEYKSLIKGTISDLKNTGGRWGGAITAGLFLQEFVTQPSRWVHLDIAGPSFTDKDKGYRTKGGTGAPVRALLEFLEAL
ncbi:MAG: leucyl aminopeptidase [Myxococcota bacterium]|nr:leucyl aminopeptidase [Myxococcota bacterium]